MIRLLSLCTLALALSACVAVGGTENKTLTAPTAGQQLIDLKTALDKGCITQDEYNQKKAQLLAQK